MKLLHFILLVLLGLLTPSMAAVSGQMTGKLDTADINQVLDLTMDKELAGRSGTGGMLVGYELRCAVDKDNTPPAPGKSAGIFLKTDYCAQWFECRADGTKKQIKKVKSGVPFWRLKKMDSRWCKDYCTCVLVDRPADHYAWNMGCVDPYSGALIQGNYGSVARDASLAEPPNAHSGLVMEAFDGPPRKE